MKKTVRRFGPNYRQRLIIIKWSEKVEEPNLEQIEEILLKLRKRLSERAAELSQPTEAPVCPHCGEKMRYKGQKETIVESRLGTLHLSRGYYYCFPLGQANGAKREELE